MVPIIVPDTTELRRSQALTSGGWGDLLNRCRRGDVRIVVPEVVIREAARRFGPGVIKDLAPTTRLVEMLRSLGVGDLPNVDVIVEALGDATQFYISHVRDRLARHGAAVAPVPTVNHETILARDLAGRKPFSDSGRGYRDALIWENVLEIVRSLPDEDHVYLITKNTDDFAGKDGKLAEDLEDDLLTLGRAGVVTLLPTAVELRATLSTHFEEIDTLIAAEWETTDAGDAARLAVLGRVENIAGDLTVGVDEDSADISVIAELEAPTVESVDPDSDTFDYWSYETYEGDTISLGASVEAEAKLQGFIYKADWYSLEEDALGIEVIDADWNDHYVWVEMDLRLRFTFQVLVIGEVVEGISLDSVERLPAR